MKRLRTSLGALTVVSIMSMTAPAEAASFLFSYNGVDANNSTISFAASGTLTTTDTTTSIGGRDAFTVTGITGQRNGVGITGLAPNFPSEFDGADNFLFLTPANFTNFGVSFSLVDGTFTNLYSGGTDGLNREIFGNEITGADAPFGFIAFNVVPAQVAAVPEPATWAMMLLGFGAIGTAMRRGNGKVSTRIRFA